jgi:hypothetical protein
MDLPRCSSLSSSSKEEAVLLSPDYAAMLRPIVVRGKDIFKIVGIIRTSA